jgi:hypothetical protein
MLRKLVGASLLLSVLAGGAGAGEIFDVSGAFEDGITLAGDFTIDTSTGAVVSAFVNGSTDIQYAGEPGGADADLSLIEVGSTRYLLSSRRIRLSDTAADRFAAYLLRATALSYLE